MADSTILTPGSLTIDDVYTPENVTSAYLIKDNYLSEYNSENEKSVVRENLNIYPKNAVYTKDEVDSNIATTVITAVNKHLSVEDPHGTLNTVKEMITDMVKTDGSTPFTVPQTGVDPISELHLTTKKFVTKLLDAHIKLVGTDDPHKLLPEVLSMLQKYVKSSDIYTKSQLYTQSQVNKLLSSYLKKDGSTPFTIAQIGVDPTIDSHLATKRYVDKTLYAHLVDVDPHGFLAILNQRLASYAKTSNVYDKTLTYSRTLVDAYINKWVLESISQALAEYMESVDDKFETIRQDHYVKQDGTVAFKNPQSGVDATDPEHLVTLKLLETKAEELKNSIESIWVTSGPIEATVGKLDEGTDMPETMTLQLICDAIFYGKSISIDVPENVTITKTATITVCIHGSTALVDTALLFLNGKVIYTFTKEDFENGCVTIESEAVTEDTEFTFKVTYTNETIYEESATVKCAMPVFVGLLPKWKQAYTITMDYLELLSKEDTKGTLNQFLDAGGNVSSLSFKYEFSDTELRHPFIVLPKLYPDLNSMVTKSLSFGLDAFEVINDIPLKVKGVEKDIIYKIYVYKEALATLNLEVTFNFE